MRTFLGPLLIALTSVQMLCAQTEFFDIDRFVRPSGWSRAESSGIVVLQDRKKVQGSTEFCQIYLFPSMPSRSSPAANFQSEWDARIARPLGITVRPSPQIGPESEGWMPAIGHVDTIIRGVPTRTMLVNATGFGKTVSVAVMVSPNSYLAEINKFFQDLNFQSGPEGQHPGMEALPPAASAAAEPREQNSHPGTGGSLDNYVFAVPANWTAQRLNDRIVLVSPLYPNGERCQLTMLPMQPSSQPPANDALGLFRQLFHADPLTSYPSPPPILTRGVSPQGWEYFGIRKLVGGQEGEARTTGVTLLLARLDTQNATIVGTSKDFLWSRCFGQLDGDAWPRFFSSLGFKNAQPSKQAELAIQQRLAGTWLAATGNVGLGYTFLGNGRYKSTGVTQYRTPASNEQTLETTQAFFGDGSYSFDGNTMILNRDDHQRSTTVFRLEQVSKDSGQTWREELCLSDPGSAGEVCYRKE
jgi:hypothetical protein